MKRLQDFFNLSSKERHGFLLFTIFILVLTLIPTIWLRFHRDPVPEYALHYFPAVNLYERADAGMPTNKNVKSTHNDVVLEPFDPNGLPATEWAKMGLSAKQIAVIHRYEERGGVFRKKEDVQKLYVIDDAFYHKIAPYIRIAASAQTNVSMRSNESWPYATDRSSRDEYKPRERPVVRVEINQADTTAWKQIRGIGSAYAARIVRFRELLGGFHQIAQVGEVYGLPEDRLEEWFAQLYIESPRIRKLSINTLEVDALQKHPYISRKQADWIVKYRNQHGAFQSIDDLRKIVMLDTDFFIKIEPYLDFQR